VHFLQATRGLLLALLSDFLHLQCLLALSKFLRTSMGIITEHIAYVGREDKTELTSCNLPAWVRRDEIAIRCLSALSIKGAKCSIFGFVLPIGRPR
jgi:hypothetical protein